VNKKLWDQNLLTANPRITVSLSQPLKLTPLLPQVKSSICRLDKQATFYRFEASGTAIWRSKVFTTVRRLSLKTPWYSRPSNYSKISQCNSILTYYIHLHHWIEIHLSCSKGMKHNHDNRSNKQTNVEEKIYFVMLPLWCEILCKPFDRPIFHWFSIYNVSLPFRNNIFLLILLLPRLQKALLLSTKTNLVFW